MKDKSQLVLLKPLLLGNKMIVLRSIGFFSFVLCRDFQLASFGVDCAECTVVSDQLQARSWHMEIFFRRSEIGLEVA